MAFQKTARKDSAFRIVCILPDFCFLPTPPTPPQAPPIPFPLTTDLGKAKSVARDVLINKKPAFVFDASYAPKTFGDEPADPKVPPPAACAKKASSPIPPAKPHGLSPIPPPSKSATTTSSEPATCSI